MSLATVQYSTLIHWTTKFTLKIFLIFWGLMANQISYFQILFKCLSTVDLHRHLLQLPVKSALTSEAVVSSIAEIRQTCKFFRKSAVASEYQNNMQMRKALTPLRLL